MRKRSKKVSAPQARRGDKHFVAPTVVLPRAGTSNDRICWRFCHADREGRWKVDSLALGEIMDKLVQFETMTVREIFNNGEEPGKHYEVAQIPNPEAQRRLEELSLGDMVTISRLRLGGKPRLYGFLVDNVFHMLWWDPEHEIWPSQKKHT